MPSRLLIDQGMDKIMVLIKFIVTGLFIILLSACSAVQNKSAQPLLIPAQTTMHTNQIPLPNNAVLHDKSTTTKAVTDGSHAKEQPLSQQKTEQHSETRKPYEGSDILPTLLEQAKKAIKLQQWLRAQRTLEQAIRIAPSNPKIFLLYGETYQHLGVLKEAENMYQHALHLATDQAELKTLAEEALRKLSDHRD
jgi:Flp pilus assembly protein TadD